MGDLDGLVSIAAQLVARVHDDDPDANGRWLAAVTDDADRWVLLFILAAMVPEHRTVAQLVAWCEEPPGGFDTAGNVAQRRRLLNAALSGARRDPITHRSPP